MTQTFSSAEAERPAWTLQFEGRDVPDVVIQEKGLTTILDDAAEKHGDRKAIVFQNLKMSYAELRKQAEIFAAALRREGVQTGDRVAIMLPNIPQTMVAVWGVLKAGAVAVMTNPLYMEKELTHHFSDSGAKILITLDLLWNKITPLYPKLDLRLCIVTRIADGLAFPLNILQPWKARREGQTPDVPYDGKKILTWKHMFTSGERYAAEITDPKNTLALLQYTGGTTGFAKAAMLSHQNLFAQMQILKYIVGGDAESKQYTFLSIMPFFHVFGLVGNIMVPALYAGTSIPVPRYTPHDLLETIRKYRPNFFVGAPSVYISLMQQKNIAQYHLTCIELCISGSAPFPTEAMRKFQQMTHARITEGFGLTEASPVISANPLYGRQKAGSVGVPAPATELRIVDVETGTKTLGNNESGELVARGPQVMLGYWNKPAETADTLRDGWLYTGDIAYRDDDGYYFIVDRKKDMAIVGGYNVYPREIDEVLYEHPKVAEAVAVSVPHPSRGEILKAYVVPKKGETLTVAELTAHCRAKLANYKVPRSFEFRDELPKTLIGKVLRRALREEESRKVQDGLVPDDTLLPTAEGDSAASAPAMRALREKAEALMQEAQERAEELRHKAEELYRQAEELMNEGRDNATVQALREKAKEAAGGLKEKARGASEELREKAKEAADGLKEKSEELGISQKAREKSEEFRVQAEELLHFAREKADEMAKRLEHWRGKKEGGSAPEKSVKAEEPAAASAPVQQEHTEDTPAAAPSADDVKK